MVFSHIPMEIHVSFTCSLIPKQNFLLPGCFHFLYARARTHSAFLRYEIAEISTVTI